MFGGGKITTEVDTLLQGGKKEEPHLIMDVSIPNGEAEITYVWAMPLSVIESGDMTIDEVVKTMFDSNMGELIDIHENPEKHGFFRCDECEELHSMEDMYKQEEETSVPVNIITPTNTLH